MTPPKPQPEWTFQPPPPGQTVRPGATVAELGKAIEQSIKSVTQVVRPVNSTEEV